MHINIALKDEFYEVTFNAHFLYRTILGEPKQAVIESNGGVLLKYGHKVQFDIEGFSHFFFDETRLVITRVAISRHLLKTMTIGQVMAELRNPDTKLVGIITTRYSGSPASASLIITSMLPFIEVED